MLDVDKVVAIAEANSPQELVAALVWQRQFNRFDGREVITDLVQYRQLWTAGDRSADTGPEQQGLE